MECDNIARTKKTRGPESAREGNDAAIYGQRLIAREGRGSLCGARGIKRDPQKIQRNEGSATKETTRGGR